MISNQMPLVKITHKGSSNCKRIETSDAACWSEKKELDVTKHWKLLPHLVFPSGRCLKKKERKNKLGRSMCDEKKTFKNILI